MRTNEWNPRRALEISIFIAALLTAIAFLGACSSFTHTRESGPAMKAPWLFGDVHSVYFRIGADGTIEVSEFSQDTTRSYAFLTTAARLGLAYAGMRADPSQVGAALESFDVGP